MFKHCREGLPAKNNQLVVLSAPAMFAVDLKKIFCFLFITICFLSKFAADTKSI